ncbi:MFS transporter [Rhodococcoides fascians]|uniref:MFS transporter n=1 Tax=Rhodococcoides fascians TaxID=1828 RepID=UPI00068DBE5F|nr:aromatic acid/H+ symport family MFS transporter [Rhodococcus fascians]
MQSSNVGTVVSESKLNRKQIAVLAMCCALMAIDGYDVVAYGTVLPFLMTEWGLDVVTGGTLGSIALVGLLVGGLFVSPWADRVGRRPLTVASLVVGSCASFLCAFAESTGTLGPLRFCVGVALGALVPNMLALVGECSPAKYKAMFVSTVSAFYCMGGVAAAVVAIKIEPVWSWRGVFYLAAVPLLLVPVLLRWLPESPEYLAVRGRHEELRTVLQKIAPDTADRFSPVMKQPRRVSENNIRLLFTNSNFYKSALIWTFFAMCMLLSYGLNTWLPKLMQTAGYELGSALWTLVTLNAGGFVGGIFGGWIAGRTSYRSTLVAYFCLAVLSLGALSFNPPVLLLNTALFLAGAASIGTLAIVHAFAVEYYPAGVRSTGVGWASGIGRLGAIAGPALGGGLLGLGLSFQQNFLLVAIPGVIGAAAVATLARTRFTMPSASDDENATFPVVEHM